MCGICGIYNFSSPGPVLPENIEKMCQALVHRGPDDRGSHISGPIGLGHRRLSIIDLQTGQQPIYNEDKSVVVIFNGEIYNFPELRQQLSAKGHCFYTQTDTEVVAHLYEEYGRDCVKHLRGMFAFAVWDEKNRKLLLARDRVGKKPLVYAIRNGALVFASELKALLAWPGFQPGIDPEAIHYFITYQYVPSPLTIFKEIRKLPPASILECSADGKIEIYRYWDLDFRPKIKVNETEAAELVREKLTAAVKMRLLSDVPLGAFLSGGLDSSIIVGLMSCLSSQPVKTFSIGFEEDDFSEIGYACLVAKHFKTQHQEFIVKPNTIEILPKLVWHYNEPFGDSSALPSYYVARETKRFVTVALNGDGGDENFAGYLRYRANMLAARLDFLKPLLANSALQKVIGSLPHREHQKNRLRAFKRFALALGETPARRNIAWHCIFDQQYQSQLYSDSFKQTVAATDSYQYLTAVFNQARAGNFLEQLLYTDIMTYLPEDLLVKMDIACMANSLEARSPFLDHEFMELAASLPAQMKLKGQQSKYILKKAFAPILPPEILKRGKMGFGVPIEKWFRRELKDYVRDILLSQRSSQRGYFRREFVEKLIQQHAAGKMNHGYRLWSLLNLELWHRIFIDGEKV
ncbi:MAG: asparagine synthase (glutamine-hydrolyzing) [bacterium]|nr:asparagine synthase (glutamine-hydrolyzing) [bacterium]